jgi:putative ABC transport system permease protein
VTLLSHAWRSWKAAPGISLLAVVAFAVGLGSATAIFTVISGVMLRPVPYQNGARFTVLFGALANEPGRYMTSSVADLVEYQRRTTSFDLFGWFRMVDATLITAGEPQYVQGVLTTPVLVRGLGVPPLLGRWFDDENSAVLSYALWRRLGADPAIVGSAITLDDRRVTISGVMPPDFRFPVGVLGVLPADIVTALPPVAADDRAGQGVHVAYARHKPGVSFAQAEADVKRVAAQIAQSAPDGRPNYTADLVPLRPDVFGELRPVLLTLLAAAIVLVLIACANVATLLLARSVARARDTAIQVALGVSRAQLALRYLAESSGLAVAGAVAGTAMSVVLVRGIAAVGSDYLPDANDLPIDWRVLVFGIGIVGAASALATLAPLWQAMRIAPNAVLAEGVRSTAGTGARRLSHGLVVAEIALAFTLLTVASILVVHLRDLGRVAPGFEPNDLLAFQITIPQRINSSERRVPYVQRLVDALRAMPDVTAVAFSSQLPLDGCCFGGTINAQPNPAVPDTRRASFVFSTPEYLETMQIPLRAGRFLSAADLMVPEGSNIPIVINESAARRYWPDRNPVGVIGQINLDDARFQVIGIAGNVRNDGLNATAEAELYLPWTIFPINPLRVFIRSSLPPERLVPLVRQAIRNVDTTLAIHDVRRMTDVVQGSLQLERISSLMMVFFAVAAVVMATLGIYGVVAYAVRRRTVEIGTRMALGAVAPQILGLVLGSGLRMAAGGVLIGAIALVGAVWGVTEFLEVRTIGWLPFTASTALVAAVTAAASFAPAWRATSLSPIVAIRDERTSAFQSAATRVRRGLRSVGEAVSGPEQQGDLSAAVLADFVAAARAAESYADAQRAVLEALCTKLAVPSALLLARSDDRALRPLVAIGVFASTAPELRTDGFLSRRLDAYPLPLPLLPGELEALIGWAAEHRPDRLDEIRWLAAVSVRLAVPLRAHAEMIGMLVLGPPGGRDQYTYEEKQMLRICADQFALMIENARLSHRALEQEKVRRDLALAAEVQKRLLPSQPPADPFADFSAVSIPARSIGGDYYDFVDAGEHRVGMALADVSGKGIAAALIMSVVQASLRIVTSDDTIAAPQLAAKLNQFLYRSTPASKYATFFYGQIDSGCRQLRYVNAGHNPPYLFRAGQDSSPGGSPPVEELTTGGMVVGMFPEAEYEEGVVDLRPGDVLVAFTDGVPEAHNPAGEEFGEDRLKQVVGAAVTLPAAAITEKISAALERWIQDAEQYDDLTFVVMKVNESMAQ